MRAEDTQDRPVRLVESSGSSVDRAPHRSGSGWTAATPVAARECYPYRRGSKASQADDDAVAV
ncbi:hypothetical protein BB31_08515 [Amycolatopsis lurida NRRL 2430]|uniref:Uncharacterized protein n=1 Tax=Amycolatopsis lurida NRRL 2430 TaxID=1460371 RepID=A0A2P2FYR8_AMYLU|nr:hypothetical protein BB31_08515 [Amycolatopsis lurida NRRL 2430]